MKSRYETNHEAEAEYYGEMAAYTASRAESVGAGGDRAEQAATLAKAAAHEAFLAHPELRDDRSND